MKIWDLPTTEKDAIEFLQNRGLLHKTRKCHNDHEMKLYYAERPFWKRNKCNQKMGLRSGNWFSNTRLPFLSIVRFIYCWSEELTLIKWCEKQLDICKETVIDWNMYLRETCVSVLLDKEKKIGGESMIVEIDESIYKKKIMLAGSYLNSGYLAGSVGTPQCFIVQVSLNA